MVGTSILPVAFYKNKLYFLFGKENAYEKSAPGFSDFGGRCEKGESLYQGALREGAEELTGFLGSEYNLNKHIKENGGYYKISNEQYHIHIFLMDYDPNLPKYYNNNHSYLWKQGNNTCDKHLFEKIEIQWFSLEDMKKKRSRFRNFYRSFIDMIILQEKDIRKHFNLR